MYFQQIFWCVYNKGSDLAGDMPFLKGKIYAGRSIGVSNFSHRNEGKKGAKEKQKRRPEQVEEVKVVQWHSVSPNLKSRKFASCLCLNFKENLWIGIRKKTQPSAWLSCKQCFREQTIHSLTLFCFCFCLCQDAAICLHIQNTVINTNRRLKREQQLNLPNQEYGKLR